MHCVTIVDGFTPTVNATGMQECRYPLAPMLHVGKFSCAATKTSRTTGPAFPRGSNFYKIPYYPFPHKKHASNPNRNVSTPSNPTSKTLFFLYKAHKADASLACLGCSFQLLCALVTWMNVTGKKSLAHCGTTLAKPAWYGTGQMLLQ